MAKMPPYLVAAAALSIATPAATDIVLTIACGSSTAEFTTCTSNAQSWEQQERKKGTAVRVKIFPVPDDTDERHKLYEQEYKTNTHNIDIFPIDIIWTDSDSDHFINLKEYQDTSLFDSFDKSIIDNNTINNRIIALPAFADGGMLYSRVDLIRKHYRSLQNPDGCIKKIAKRLTPRSGKNYGDLDWLGRKLKNFLDFVDKSDSNHSEWDWTWGDLTGVAKYIQELERHCEHNPQIWGLIWQGKHSDAQHGGHSEALTCSALEWIGGTRETPGRVNPDKQWIIHYCPIDPDIDPAPYKEAIKEAIIDREAVMAGIKMAHDWIWSDEISPFTVLNYGRYESEAMFASGNAVFMRHWPSAWSAVNTAIRDSVTATYLPRNVADKKTRVSTLGGWEFAVSQRSKYRKEAVTLVDFLTQPAQQMRNAVTGVFRPTKVVLYEKDIGGNMQLQLGHYNRIFEDPDPRKADVISAIRPSKRTDFECATKPSIPSGEKTLCFSSYEDWSKCFSAVVYTMLSSESIPEDKSKRKEQLQSIERDAIERDDCKSKCAR